MLGANPVSNPQSTNVNHISFMNRRFRDIHRTRSMAGASGKRWEFCVFCFFLCSLVLFALSQ